VVGLRLYHELPYQPPWWVTTLQQQQQQQQQQQHKSDGNKLTKQIPSMLH
jgi:hypothetical protein